MGGQWQLSSRKPYASHLVQRLEISWSHRFCQIQECWGPPATEGGGHRECRQGTGHGRGPQAAAGRGATNSRGHQSDWTASGHVAEGSTEEPETKRTHTLPGRLGSGGWSEAVESQRLLPLERAGVWVRDTGKEGLAASCGVCRTTMRCSWAYPGTRANSLGWRRGGLEHKDRQRGRINTNAWHSCS